MNKPIFLILAVALALIVSAGTTSGQQTPSVETLSIPDVTATIYVTRTASGQPIVIANVSTTDPRDHNVSCFNAYRDLQYSLRDATGKTIPVNTDAWKTNPVTMTQHDIPQGPCEKFENTQTQSRALISALFPNLPHGTYELQITLAPRWLTGRATAAPVVMNL
jgi:hypothetical protein